MYMKLYEILVKLCGVGSSFPMLQYVIIIIEVCNDELKVIIE